VCWSSSELVVVDCDYDYDSGADYVSGSVADGASVVDSDADASWF
jgi:hypothetical protein